MGSRGTASRDRESPAAAASPGRERPAGPPRRSIRPRRRGRGPSGEGSCATPEEPRQERAPSSRCCFGVRLERDRRPGERSGRLGRLLRRARDEIQELLIRGGRIELRAPPREEQRLLDPSVPKQLSGRLPKVGYALGFQPRRIPYLREAA